jgi:hypothetical protein
MVVAEVVGGGERAWWRVDDSGSVIAKAVDVVVTVGLPSVVNMSDNWRWPTVGRC